MADSGKLLTLTEVSKRTNISMPTLQRYKKLYQARIPSEGAGRSQRYRTEALEVFLQLKKENVSRRGRPRKSAVAARAARPVAPKAPAKKRGRPPGRPRKKAAAKAKPAAKATAGLLTLTEISNRTKISYPTLLRYVKANLSEIPHEGAGRGRRYHKGAVDIFKKMRSESSRGRKPGPGRPPKAKPVAKRRGRPPKKAAAAAPTGRGRGRPPKEYSGAEITARFKELEKTNKALVRRVAKLEKQLAKPIRLVAKR